MPFGILPTSRAWLISTSLHVITLVVIAQCWIVTNTPAEAPDVIAKWDEEQSDIVDRNPIILPQSFAFAAGKSRSDSASSSAISDETDLLTLPVTPVPAMSFPTRQVSTKVKQRSGRNNAGLRIGDGDVGGQPIELGEGFFGGRLKGTSFVFVLDASKSMNHPHKSEAKTRFKRLKIELVNTVAKLLPHQQFYIIFFNTAPHPMPSQRMQVAAPAEQARFLGWAQKMRATGDTDPRHALQLALRLEPDVIFFLTDGSFLRPIQKELKSLTQHRTRIYTYAFGDKSSEQLLKELAERNRGEYTYIP